MRTERPSGAAEPTAESSLAHAPDPASPGVVAVYDPDAEGPAIASRWLTVDEGTLRDVADWR
jgi:hypothetical protein